MVLSPASVDDRHAHASDATLSRDFMPGVNKSSANTDHLPTHGYRRASSGVYYNNAHQPTSRTQLMNSACHAVRPSVPYMQQYIMRVYRRLCCDIIGGRVPPKEVCIIEERPTLLACPYSDIQSSSVQDRVRFMYSRTFVSLIRHKRSNQPAGRKAAVEKAVMTRRVASEVDPNRISNNTKGAG